MQTDNRLYDLLPVIYRQRDHEQGEPLKALLQVMSEQLDLVEQDISQLYDNWFVETCDDWVVPYIGELIGYDVLHEGGETTASSAVRDINRNSLLIPRSEVANTIQYRRRKGTLALLELLARSVAGWPARAIEFHPLTHKTQAINHLQSSPAPVAQSIDLNNVEPLAALNTAFDSLSHSVDIRRIHSTYKPGRYNCPSVGLFVWRLQPYSITQSPAYCLESVNAASFTFSVLGNDIPLYINPKAEADPHAIGDEINLPLPISRPLLERRLDQLYGSGKSLQIWTGESKKGHPDQVTLKPVTSDQLIVTDLSNWNFLTPNGKVAIDPELGRIAFPSRRPPKSGVWVSYHNAFSHAMGGGEYVRPLHQPHDSTVYYVGQDQTHDTINAALKQWQQDAPPHAVIEITDNRVYVEPIKIQFSSETTSLQLRAANSTRPVIRMLDWQTDKADALVIAGEANNRFTLEGLMLAGRGLQITGDMTHVNICHSTLVPGWNLDEHCEPKRPSEPSIEVYSPKVCLTIQHSIIGSIQLDPSIAVVESKPLPPPKEPAKHCDDDLETADDNENLIDIRLDPIKICINDSILDATDPQREAIGAPGCPVAHACLTIARSTVIGQVQVDSIALAENSIFYGQALVARSQQGCMRFSYIAPGSRTPQRYRCQPDLVIDGLDVTPGDDQREQEQQRVKPLFNSLRYGNPDYCQLSLCCAEEITQGADDESEMGAFHDLYQPQRLANLTVRLNEYTPAGTDAGIIIEN